MKGRLALALAILTSLVGQRTLPGPLSVSAEEQQTYHTQTSLALIYFQLTNHSVNAPSLRMTDIEILSDREPQRIQLLEGGPAGVRTVPTEVILVFDCRRSVRAIEFTDPTALKEQLLDQFPEVGISVYAFGHGAYCLIKPTRNVDQLKLALAAVRRVPPETHHLKERGKSQIGFGEVNQIIQATTKNAPPARRLMVLYSDGGSGYASPVTIRTAQEENVSIYPVLVHRDNDGGSDLRHDGRSRSRGFDDYLDARFLELGASTGGRGFTLYNAGIIPMELLTDIAQCVRSEYIAGFSPVVSEPPQVHHIRVALKSNSLGKLRGGERALTY